MEDAKPAPAPAEKLTVFTWSEYLDPETLERFKDETGIEVVYEEFSTAGEMEGRLRSERRAFDVVIVDDSIVKQLQDLGLIRQLDKTKLPNLRNIGAKYRDMPVDPSYTWCAPYLWGTTLVAYRKDLLGNGVKESWSTVFEAAPETPTMWLEEPGQLFSTYFAYGGGDPQSTDPAAFERAASGLSASIREGRVSLGGDEEVKEALTSGAVSAAMCYSTDAAMLAEDDERIGYFIPAEGAPMWIDCFVIPRDAGNVDEAHVFINFMLGAEAAAASTNYTWCATANEAAVPMIDPEILGDPRIYPPDSKVEKCFFLPSMDEGRQSQTNAGFFEIGNALRDAGARKVDKRGETGAGEVEEAL